MVYTPPPRPRDRRLDLVLILVAAAVLAAIAFPHILRLLDPISKALTP